MSFLILVTHFSLLACTHITAFICDNFFAVEICKALRTFMVPELSECLLCYSGEGLVEMQGAAHCGGSERQRQPILQHGPSCSSTLCNWTPGRVSQPEAHRCLESILQPPRTRYLKMNPSLPSPFEYFGKEIQGPFSPATPQDLEFIHAGKSRARADWIFKAFVKMAPQLHLAFRVSLPNVTFGSILHHVAPYSYLLSISCLCTTMS